MKRRTWKVNDVAMIIANHHGHHFKIGEITVVETIIADDDYMIVNNSRSWFLGDSEIYYIGEL